ncbi:MAG: hypothetical protein ACLQED_09275 [Desulfobaccales bacterium]|jgi:hypothetical protein
MMEERHLLDGVPLRLGGQDYILPPLNLAALEKYWPVIESWGEPPASLVQRLSEAAELLHAALLRNYPELTLAEVKEGLDLASFPAILPQLLEVSGLTRRPPGEPQAGSVPIGATSMPG